MTTMTRRAMVVTATAAVVGVVAGERPSAAAVARGETTIDQVFSVPPTAGTAMQGLAALLADADRLCEDNVLMTPPRPPLLRRFADWYTGEVLGQSAGRAPRPWEGPSDLPADSA